MKRWLRRLRKLLELLSLLRPAQGGGGGGGRRSPSRQKPQGQPAPRFGAKDYVTVGGRSFVLQRGPGGTVRIFDTSGRSLGVVQDRGEANEVMAELAAEANEAQAPAGEGTQGGDEAATGGQADSGGETGGGEA